MAATALSDGDGCDDGTAGAARVCSPSVECSVLGIALLHAASCARILGRMCEALRFSTVSELSVLMCMCSDRSGRPPE